MAHGIITPLPRIVGPTDAEISGVTVPAGVRGLLHLSYEGEANITQTVVAMGATVVHRNAEIFPEPYTFSPERWLQSDSQDLERYLVSFSKGPRSCLGIKYVYGLYSS